MTFNFTVKEFLLGGGNGTPTLQFYKKGFNVGGGREFNFTADGSPVYIKTSGKCSISIL